MDPYIGEIRMFPYFSFSGQAPVGWLACDGQRYNMSQFQALAAVIGITYGGDYSTNTFAVPNLMGYAPVGNGQGPGLSPYKLGVPAGDTQITLSLSQMPEHSHTMTVKDGKNTKPAGNAVFLSNPDNADLNLPLTRPAPSANYTFVKGFSPAVNVYLALQTLSPAGSGAAHENRQPFLAFLFCIAWDGVFPVPAS